MATKLEAVYVRLEPKLKARLQAEADDRHRSLSNWIALLLINHLDDQEPTKSLNGADHKPKARATA